MRSDPSLKPRKPIIGPAVWYGRHLTGTNVWQHCLSEEEIAEIDAAVAGVIAGCSDLARIEKNQFRLPRLSRVLRGIANEVVHGRGFVLLRGLPMERYTAREAAAAFWGIGMHLGRAVPQSAEGDLLGHVRDIGHDPRDPLTRIYATRAAQPFHTDSCDVVALLCLKTAKRGGSSSLSSTATIYNEMLVERPDLVDELGKPFFVDRKGEIPAGKRDYYRMPVFHEYRGRLITVYARDFINVAQRHAEVPRLTASQIEALDTMDALAARADIRLDMELMEGDLQIVHNHQIVHARSAYEDYAEPERRRHLLRLWLSPPDDWPLPPVFEERYGSVTPGWRGGIRVPGSVEHA